MNLIVGIAPIAAIVSLIGTFFGLGGWGWLLFLWFGFIGMFSMGEAKLLKEDESDNGTINTSFSVGISLLLLFAFLSGVLFAISDLPKKIPVYYALFIPLVLIPIFLLFNKKPKDILLNSNILLEFESEIESWPEEQAKAALLFLKSSIRGDQYEIESLYPVLKVSQVEAVERVLRRMENKSENE